MKTCSPSILAIFLCVTLCNAQTSDDAKMNAISFELGKTGFIYNLNVDHKLVSKNFGFRFGVGSNLGQCLNAISVGGGSYYLRGKQNSFFELGLDIQYLLVDEVSGDQKGFASIFIYPDYPIKTIYPSINLGYRRYGKNSLFRVGLAPGMIQGELIPGGYISYGFTF